MEKSIGGRRQEIDHLSPDTAAWRQGYGYVRVIPVDAAVNRRVGATVERVLARSPARAGGFQADWTTAAKVLGMQRSFGKSRPERDVAGELLKLMRSAGIVDGTPEIETIMAGWIGFQRDSGQGEAAGGR